MRKIKSAEHEADIWVSSDVYQEGGEGRCDFMLELMMTGVSAAEREYIDLYLTCIRKQRTAFLLAHGDCINGEWRYFDSGKACSVQKWIKRREGDYGLLIIASCNPGAHTPVSRRSLVMIPDAILSGIHMGLGECKVSLIHPQHGEMSYIIEHELAELKNRIGGTAK